MITIDSIQIGRIRTEGNPNSRASEDCQWTTGFYKRPATQPVTVDTMGIVGDEVADTRNHGGADKAILCYAAAHYERWTVEHPDLAWTHGAFGENLTLAGATETDVCLGDRWRIGTCELQISQPRKPCWKIARRWGTKTLTKEVAQTGRTGWYVRVLAGGTLKTGQSCQLIDRPHPQWSVARANDMLFGREVDRVAVIELMSITELPDAWKSDIA